MKRPFTPVVRNFDNEAAAEGSAINAMRRGVCRRRNGKKSPRKNG